MKISATVNRLVNKADSQVKAFASVTFDGYYAVHGIRILENEKGRYAAMPSTSYTDKDGNKQYQNTFHPITKGARDALTQAVLNAYEQKLQQVQQTEIEVEKLQNAEVSEQPRVSEPETGMVMG